MSSEGERIGLRLFDGQRSASVASSDFSDDSWRCWSIAAWPWRAQAPEDPYAGLAPAELLELRTPPRARQFRPRRSAPADASRDARSKRKRQRSRFPESPIRAGSAQAPVLRSRSRSRPRADSPAPTATAGHGCLAAVIAGEGQAMQRDHAWHSARYLDDLDDARKTSAGAPGRARSRGSTPRRAKAGPLSGAVRPARLRRPAQPFRRGDQRVGRSRAGPASSRTGSASKVFATGVTIVDDPLRPRGLRSRPFDGEGVHVARRELVTDGRAQSMDRRQRLGPPARNCCRPAMPSAGAARSPSHRRAICDEPGKRSRDELLAAFPEAVLVVELIGQGINGVTGDYSRGAVGLHGSRRRDCRAGQRNHHRLQPDRHVRDARAGKRPRVPQAASTRRRSSFPK